jgi:uncharacterized protein
MVCDRAASAEHEGHDREFASGDPESDIGIVVATIFLSVVTPIGEEFTFRGVATTVLLRYGAVARVVGGAIILRSSHGINIIFPAALVTGLAAGEVFRRSGSIWPCM